MSSPRHRRLYLLLITALPLALLACGGGGGGGTEQPPITGPGGPGGPSGPVTTTSVSMRNSGFTPPSIVVARGATVSFTNEDGIDHNATFELTAIGTTGSFASGTSSVTMPGTAGTYNYRCTLHGGMNGSVKVE